MIFWAAEGGPDPKIAEILDLGSEISYEGGVFLQRGGIFVKLSTDILVIAETLKQRHQIMIPIFCPYD